jgi:hypothetical protein
MKPACSILDRSFRYVPAAATSVSETWRRFGWQPTTAEERDRQLGPPGSFAIDQSQRLRVPPAPRSQQRVLPTFAQHD